MLPSGGFTGELSPDAVLTGIDGVLYEEFTRTSQPGHIGATDGNYFKVGPTVGVGFIHDEDSGIGDYEEIGEQEEFLNTDSFIGNQVTRRSQKYYKQIPVTDEAFRADMVGKRADIGKKLGEKARQTQDKKAMLNTYGDATVGAQFTTPDGQALASNSHVTLKGATVDNLGTGGLNPDNLWTEVNALANQKGQDGDAGSHVFENFLACFNLYKTAKEVMDSSLIANSGENAINIFDTVYGQVRIGASIFLGSAFNSAANTNTTYSLTGRNHQILRKVFYGLTTDMKTPRETNNDCYAHVSKFHEVCYPGTWTAFDASTGAA